MSTKVGAVAAALALVGGAGAALAQSAASQHGRTIEVPPGAVVIVLPGPAVTGSAAWPGFSGDGVSMPVVAGPAALMRQMDAEISQMMEDMQRAFGRGWTAPGWGAPGWIEPGRANPDRLIEAAMRPMPGTGGPVSGVMVTTCSDGRNSCTQRVVYSGTGRAPTVQVSSTGNGCAGTDAPAVQPAAPSTARTLQVDNRPQSVPVSNRQHRLELAQTAN
jgi:hypothetical protein